MDLSSLNKMQHLAVTTTEGSVLIIAGAGSGKTGVLTKRIAYLISEKGVYPNNILAFTFTNKAAREMKQRVENMVGDYANGMWLGTFHSICVRILRREADKLGYKSDFVIYDTSDRKVLIKECMKELNINDKQIPVNMVQNLISSAKNDLISPNEFKDNVYGEYPVDVIAKIYELYQTKIVKNNAMDFDDLIWNVLKLFGEYTQVLEYYQNKFKYVHVDEYQDTNKAQYKLIRYFALSHKNLCVVGDEDQSIYSWRGADITNIYSLEKDFPDIKLIKLEQNYRSTQNILNAANAVIEKNTERKEKQLWTDNGIGEKIKYYGASNEYKEAEFVVGEILKKSFKSGFKYSDFAILYRTNAQSRVFEDILLKNNIPYTIVGGLKFYERKEIKDFISYMRLIQNSVDDVSFMRVVNSPKRSIGAKSLEKMSEFGRINDLSMFQSAAILLESGAFSKKASDGLNGFLNFIMTYSNKKAELSAMDIYNAIYSESGYVDSLIVENTIEAKSRIENIKEFKNVIEEFEKSEEDKTLENFLAMISLKSDVDSLTEDDSAVVMMTIHSAKGLEFPVVFLVGLEENIFPSSMSLSEDSEAKEERRLCYVGITRAEKLLYLTNAYQRNRFGRTEVNSPSRFLADIPFDYMESITGESPVLVKQKISFSGEFSKYKTDDIFSKKDSKSSIKRFTNSLESSTKPQNDNLDINTGDKIEHTKFGIGTIVAYDVKKDMITIAFETNGIKKLKKSLSPITKL